MNGLGRLVSLNSQKKLILVALCLGPTAAWWAFKEKQSVRKEYNFKPLPDTRSSEHLHENGGIRILSIDGGGVRGIIPIMLLEEIERHLEKKGARSPYIVDNFDLISGTSTGGLIALAHGLHRYKLSDVKQVYKDNRIFQVAFGPCSKAFSMISTGARHSVEELERLLQEFFGNSKLNESTGLPKVVVTSRENTHLVALHLFANYADTKNDPHQVTHDCKIWHAARATTAAPTYFPPFIINNTPHLDGGLGCNNPVEVATEQAVKLWPNKRPAVIVSVGTGKPPATGISLLYRLLDKISLDLTYWFRTVSATATASEDQVRRMKEGPYKDEFIRLNVEGIDCALNETDHSVISSMVAHTEEWIKNHQDDFELIAQAIVNNAPLRNCKAAEDVRRIIKYARCRSKGHLLMAEEFPNSRGSHEKAAAEYNDVVALGREMQRNGQLGEQCIGSLQKQYSDIEKRYGFADPKYWRQALEAVEQADKKGSF